MGILNKVPRIILKSADAQALKVKTAPPGVLYPHNYQLPVAGTLVMKKFLLQSKCSGVN